MCLSLCVCVCFEARRAWACCVWQSQPWKSASDVFGVYVEAFIMFLSSLTLDSTIAWGLARLASCRPETACRELQGTARCTAARVSRTIVTSIPYRDRPLLRSRAAHVRMCRSMQLREGCAPSSGWASQSRASLNKMPDLPKRKMGVTVMPLLSSQEISEDGTSAEALSFCFPLLHPHRIPVSHRARGELGHCAQRMWPPWPCLR